MLNCISDAYYSIAFNEDAFGYFSSTRGPRQGDPLFPVLFILNEEVLGRGLFALLERGSLIPSKIPFQCARVSHILFVDDILIFSNGSKQNLEVLMSFLHSYENTLGQLVDWSKSVFHTKNASLSRKEIITKVTGFDEGKFPITYSRIPLHYVSLFGTIYEPLIAKISKKIASWKGTFSLPWW